MFRKNLITLESWKEAGQGINVGSGKFVKKNKRRALNRRKAGTKCANLRYKKPIITLKVCRPWKNPKFNKRRAFVKAVRPGKNQKLINIGPMFIPDHRVVELEFLFYNLNLWKYISRPGKCENILSCFLKEEKIETN